MFIDNVIWKPIEGGVNHGMFAYHVNFGVFKKKDSIREEISAAADAIFKSKIHCRNIVFCNLPDPDYFVDVMLATMATSLRDAGFRIVVQTSVPVVRAWFSPVEGLISGLVLNLGDEQLYTPFNCSEIRFWPGTNNIIEPNLPPDIQANLYIVATDAVDIDNIYSFIQKSKRSWGMITFDGYKGEVIYAGDDK